MSNFDRAFILTAILACCVATGILGYEIGFKDGYKENDKALFGSGRPVKVQTEYGTFYIEKELPSGESPISQPKLSVWYDPEGE